jgi:hypothetical protein
MAGLVPAIHAVRRIEHSQAGGRDGKLPRYKPLRLVAPKTHSCLRGRGVDGRDKPGHDGWEKEN